MLEFKRSRIQNHWLVIWSTQPLILAKLIKWVPGTPWDLVIKSKLSPSSGPAAFRQLKPNHKKTGLKFFISKEEREKKKKLINISFTLWSSTLLSIIRTTVRDIKVRHWCRYRLLVTEWGMWSLLVLLNYQKLKLH